MTTAPSPVRMSRMEAAERVGGLFERHGRMVYGICRAMLRDVHEAEDATQQVFLSAHKSLVGGATVRDAGGWLATIARNECRARIAAGMRRPLPVADEDLDALPARGDEQVRRSQVEEIRGALAKLPERQREAVVLRYLYGLRYGEVATALGLSRPATEALLFRARRALRVSLRPVAAVLVVPAVVREELALALPGFEAKSTSVAASAGVAGGLLAKLTAGSAGAKVATTAAAIATVGAVGTVNSDGPAPRVHRAVPIEQGGVTADSTSGDDDAQVGSSGVSGGRDETDESSGPGTSRNDDDREDTRDDGDDRTGSGTGSGKGADDDFTTSGPGSGTDDEASEVDSGSGSGGPGSDDGDDHSGSSGSSGSGSSGSSGSGSPGSGSSDSSGSGSDGETTTTNDEPHDD